jgi:hypothetical protein
VLVIFCELWQWPKKEDACDFLWDFTMIKIRGCIQFFMNLGDGQNLRVLVIFVSFNDGQTKRVLVIFLSFANAYILRMFIFSLWALAMENLKCTKKIQLQFLWLHDLLPHDYWWQFCSNGTFYDEVWQMDLNNNVYNVCL